MVEEKMESPIELNEEADDKNRVGDVLKSSGDL